MKFWETLRRCDLVSGAGMLEPFGGQCLTFSLPCLWYFLSVIRCPAHPSGLPLHTALLVTFCQNAALQHLLA